MNSINPSTFATLIADCVARGQWDTAERAIADVRAANGIVSAWGENGGVVVGVSAGDESGQQIADIGNLGEVWDVLSELSLRGAKTPADDARVPVGDIVLNAVGVLAVVLMLAIAFGLGARIGVGR